MTKRIQTPTIAPEEMQKLSDALIDLIGIHPDRDALDTMLVDANNAVCDSWMALEDATDPASRAAAHRAALDAVDRAGAAIIAARTAITGINPDGPAALDIDAVMDRALTLLGDKWDATASGDIYGYDITGPDGITVDVKVGFETDGTAFLALDLALMGSCGAEGPRGLRLSPRMTETGAVSFLAAELRTLRTIADEWARVARTGR